MTPCGLWLARRRLVAVLVGAHGRPERTIRAALSDDARFGLLEYVAHLGCELVATDALARSSLVPAQAARRGVAVWLADDQLVAGLLGAAGIRDPGRAAALLARLRLVPAWRATLRRLAPATPPTSSRSSDAVRPSRRCQRPGQAAGGHRFGCL